MSVDNNLFGFRETRVKKSRWTKRLNQRLSASACKKAGAAGDGSAPRIILILHPSADVEALDDWISGSIDRALLQAGLRGSPQPGRALGA